MSLRKQALSGIAWTSAARVFSQGTSFAVMLLLARLLEPSEFGLIGMVLVFSGFLSLFGELGLGAALIQRKEIEERHLSSVFWVSIVMGLLLLLGLFVAAPWIADFYREPRLGPVVRVAALEFVIAPLRLVQHAILSREMRFRALALVELVGVSAASAISLLLAFRGYGVWALVARLLVSSSVSVIVLWFCSSWRPRWLLERRAVAELSGFGFNLLGFSALNYWARQADDLLIGRFLGAGPLGLYSRAYSTMLAPLSEISAVVGRVMFPTLSRLAGQRDQMKAAYLGTVSMISFVTFPLMAILYVVAEPFVLTVYGDQWAMATTTLKIYCLVGAFQSIGMTVGWIYQAQGRTDWMFRYGLVASSVMIVGISVGVWLGSIESVAIGYAVTTVGILSYPQFAIPGRLIGMQVREVVRAVRGSLLCAILGGLAATGIVLVVDFLAPAILMLMQVVVGFGVFLGAAAVARIQPYVALRQLLARKLVAPAPAGAGQASE